MTNYIILFGERSGEIKKGKRGGSITTDNNEQNIQNINNEDEAKAVVKNSFALAINILNNNVKQLTFDVKNYENKCMWNGEGVVFGEALKIISLNRL